MSIKITNEDIKQRKIVSDNLKHLLTEKNVKKTNVAHALNIRDSTLGNYFRGIRMPPEKILNQLADYFGVEPEYILTDHTPEDSADVTVSNVTNGANSVNMTVNNTTNNHTAPNDPEVSRLARKNSQNSSQDLELQKKMLEKITELTKITERQSQQFTKTLDIMSEIVEKQSQHIEQQSRQIAQMLDIIAELSQKKSK